MTFSINDYQAEVTLPDASASRILVGWLPDPDSSGLVTQLEPREDPSYYITNYKLEPRYV